MSPVGYTAEVAGISPKATEEDLFDFFSHCGEIIHLEILSALGADHGLSLIGTRSGESACTSYVTFRDAYALETAVLLSGANILDQTVCIFRHETYLDEFDVWNNHQEGVNNGSQSMASHTDQFVSSPGEAVTVAQQVVTTMIAKGYVLGKDALEKAKAFDESNQVSATAAAKVAELSKRIGLTDKINSGVKAAKSVDEKYHVSEITKTAATYTGRTAVAAANAMVNSSYFAKGALWVSDVLDRAAKYAADLGQKNLEK